jgi:O-antigen/teichoic acid export membrane protein
VTEQASLTRGGGLIAPALTFVNVAAYAVTVAAARELSKDDYGSLVALLGVLLVACVPFIALQAVAARTVAAAEAEPRAVLRGSVRLGLAAAVVMAVLSPVAAAFLHSDVVAALWVAAQLAPFAVLSGAMGVLQGSERFGALALVIVAQGLARAAGLVPLAFSGSSADVLAAMAAGVVVAAGFAVLLAHPTGGSGGAPRLREVVTATQGVLALLVLANADVLLARNVLPGGESGRYSVGSVLAKAAFWLPQAVAVVVFPRLSDPVAGRALLRRSILLVAGLGLLEVVGCVLLARPVLEVTFGRSYGSLSSIAWLWVVQGVALSVAQLLVYRSIAVHDRVTAYVLGAAVAVEAALVLVVRPTSPGPIIAVATAVAVTTTLGLLARRTS